MKNLVSMVDFVFEQQKNHLSLRDFNITNYANFLKQPLELWMFIPCDEDGSVLEKPEMVYNVDVFGVYNGLFQNKNEYIKQYQKAKERCLFEGFEVGFRISEKKVFSAGDLIFDEEETIENLLQYKNKTFILTASALKHIGL